MSIKGGSYVRFQRAVATGNPLIALTAAQELPQLSLADALALTCVLQISSVVRMFSMVAWRLTFERGALPPPACGAPPSGGSLRRGWAEMPGGKRNLPGAPNRPQPVMAYYGVESLF